MQNINVDDNIALNDFEKLVDEKHLKPGKSLYRHKKINLYKAENGNWTATVEDGKFYTVNVRIMDGDKITKCECGCESQRKLCRHCTGVLFAIRDAINNRTL